jgi:hypothetical protein
MLTLDREAHFFLSSFAITPSSSTTANSRSTSCQNFHLLIDKMGCKHSVSIDTKSFEAPLSPTVYSTTSARTYVFENQAEIPDNYFTPEIQVVDNTNLRY